MKFSHREDKREDRQLDVLTDEETGLRIVISRLGAELISLARMNEAAQLIAHVGFGLHPGFAATSFNSFHLQMRRGLYRRHFSPGNYLSGETRDIEFTGGEMPFTKAELPGSVILEFVDVPRREFSYVDPPSGRWVILDLAGVPYVT